MEEQYEQQTHFEVLHVSSEATYEEIKIAFHRLARIYHPDRNRRKNAPYSSSSTSIEQDKEEDDNDNDVHRTGKNDNMSRYDDEKDKNCQKMTMLEVDHTLKFRRIQQAWEVLRDEEKRNFYKEELRQIKLKEKSKKGGIVTLQWAEVEEALDEDTEEIIHVFDCRCGEEVIWEKKGGIVDCSGCCFVYQLPKKL